MRDNGVAHISVIIPTKDRPGLLREALSSVGALSGKDLSLEVIVADTGSDDEAERVAASFGARYLRVADSGASAARNAGLRVAGGEFLAFLDDDDLWLPGHLRPQLSLLRNQPSLSAVVGQTVNIDPSIRVRGRPWPETLPTGGDLFAPFLHYCPQIGATVARASVLETVGYLDETLASDEDWDWHLRLALRHPVGFVPVPCVLYRSYPPASRDELLWARLDYNRRVLWRNVKRAGSRRPALGVLVRLYLEHNGYFASGFLRSATEHVQSGEYSAARRALRRATVASPVHTGWSIAVDVATRRTLLRAVSRSFVRARG